MHNKRKKIISKVIAGGLILNSIPVQAMKNAIDIINEDINEIEENISQDFIENEISIDEGEVVKNEDKVVEDEIVDEEKNLDVMDDNINIVEAKNKSVKNEPKNIIENSILEITLADGEFVPNLTDNPDGYETIKVTTTGNKKLVKADYDNLRTSKIPKVDLSNAFSDTIPEGAFANATHLTKFKFPQGVTTIENGRFGSSSGYSGAFSKCSNLTGDLIIPSSVTYIGNYAFTGCTSLNGKLVIPSSVTTIGSYAFSACKELTGNLIIPNSVTSIYENAFYNCSGFTGDLIIPDSVTRIDEYAFYNCKGFNGNLTISNSITIIKHNTFEGCSGFTGNLVIPNKVRTIGNYAFAECSNFTGELRIPNSVTNIGEYAFDSCRGFNGNLIIGDSVKTIGECAFGNCKGLVGDLIIPNSVTDIGRNAFNSCNGFKGNLTIGNSVKTIGQRAFGFCSGFTGDLIIPNSVINIKEGAFMWCSNFNDSLIIGDSVKTIGDNAFYGCDGFTGDLTIPNSVTDIGTYAFYQCRGFNGNLKIGDSVVNIGTYAFYDCRGLTGDLIIPDSVINLGKSSFGHCLGFDGNLIIGDSVKTIGDSVFQFCGKLVGELIIPDSVTTIESLAFSNCRGLTGDLIIPDSVTNIGNSAFSECNGLDGNLVIGNFVTTIGWGAFSGCNGFTGDLIIPDSVTSIGSSAFAGCSGFTGNLIMPDSVNYIGESAFYGSNIEKIIVKIDETFKDADYRSSVVKNLPIENTYLEMSYNFDCTDTWLENTKYKKAVEVSTYSGEFKNNEGIGVAIEISTPYSEDNISIIKDGVDYSLPKMENNKYIFKEPGNYEVMITTDLGVVSNIIFKNNSPVNKPNIEYSNNNITLIDNGGYLDLVKEIYETFDSPNDLKFNLSNTNWTIENGVLKSESISHNNKTENEFTFNSSVGGRAEISIKLSSEQNYDFGYILVNDTQIYAKSGVDDDFQVVEFDLKEGENTIKFIYEKDEMESYGEDAIFIDSIKIFDKYTDISPSDYLEYRINGNEWIKYTDSFKLDYPINTKVDIEARAYMNGFESEITSQSLIITDIEKPNITYNLSHTDWTNKDVTISINASDNVKVEKIILPDLTEVFSHSAIYKVAQNGEYEFTVVDTSGNKETKIITINNIDKEAPIVKHEIDKINNEYVIVDFNINDNLSKIKSFVNVEGLISLDNYKFKITKNGEYKFIAIDNAGNSSEVVIKIDSIKDVITEDLSKPITGDNSSNSQTSKPQTGDNFMILYPSLVIVSLVGLLKVNNKKEKKDGN